MRLSQHAEGSVMPTQAEVPGIVADVRQRLAEAAREGVHLRVTSDKLEDDWLTS